MRRWISSSASVARPRKRVASTSIVVGMMKMVTTLPLSSGHWGEEFAPLVSIFGPVRPAMERIKGFERMDIHIHAVERKNIQNMLKAWIHQIRQHPLSNRIKWNIDIDPM